MTSEKLAPPTYTPAASFDAKTTIAPAAYHLVGDGCKNIRVFTLPSVSERLEGLNEPLPATPEPTIPKDAEYDSDDETKSQTATMVEQSAPSDGHISDYYLFRSGVGDCILYEGGGPQKKKKNSSTVDVAEPRRLMEFKGERIFGTEATFNEVGGTGRQAKMFKAKAAPAQERDAWYNISRTLEDFNGIRYKWDTSGAITGHLSLIRMTDGAVIAHFRRPLFSWKEVGFLQVTETMSPELFYLVLSSFYAKYVVDRRRRRAIYASVASGAAAAA
ncbi:hypothetical protein FS837_013001 [Tulasnella sp. UAMH 9824]|nr:hypothetical protein FS837_013001 [Tulasnella sp. UAMH 9824]